MVGINCLFSQVFPDVLEFARLVKSHSPNTKVAIGGIHPTTFPIEILTNCPEIDFVAIGEGENTIVALVSAIEKNNEESLSEIKSFAFKDCSLNGKLVLPRDITFIGESAFEKNNITELDMSGSTQLAEIGASAFNFNNMATLNFTGAMPNLTSVGSKSFGNNSNLETINFGQITNNTSLVTPLLTVAAITFLLTNPVSRTVLLNICVMPLPASCGPTST